MQLRKYQWVGLLAGFPLFSGSWLSAYTNNNWWGIVGLAITAAGLWVAVRVEKRSSMQDHLVYGVGAGVLAVIAARLLGLITTGWAFDKWQSISPETGYVFFPDMFKNILNGSLTSLFGLALLGACVGALVSMVEPEAKESVKSLKSGGRKARK